MTEYLPWIALTFAAVLCVAVAAWTWGDTDTPAEPSPRDLEPWSREDLEIRYRKAGE